MRILGEAYAGQGCCSLYGGSLEGKGGLAFMVIASQHPIVIRLSGWSNLGAEVVPFCTRAGRTIVISI